MERGVLSVQRENADDVATALQYLSEAVFAELDGANEDYPHWSQRLMS